MQKIDKIALVDAALAGEKPERIPFSIWFHFPPSAHRGKACADAHIEHYRRYDLDYVKVMNDNLYDMPRSMPAIERAKDWLKLEPLKGDAPGFVAELEALREMKRRIGAEARFVVTIFNPLATAMKLSNGKAIEQLHEDPESTEKGLSTIAESLAVFAGEALEAGASGIFMACSGPEPSMLSQEEYRRFVKPADLRVLEAVTDAPFNLLHVHGTDVYLELFLDYPANALNWPAHHSDYSILKTSTLTDKCLVAGIDERGPITQGKMRATISQVTDAVNQAPEDRFMVGSECTVPPETSPAVITAIRDLVSQLR